MLTRTLLLLLAGFFTIGDVSSFLMAQEAAREESPALRDQDVHTFYSPDDEVLVKGKFISLDGTTVEIFDINGVKQTFKIREFCKQDQRYIREMAVRNRKFKKNEEETIMILAAMQRAETMQLIKLCNRLRGFGAAAHKAENSLMGLFEHEDPRLKRAAFVAFAHVCEPNEKNFRKMINEMNVDLWKMTSAFEKHPDDFLVALNEFGDIAQPYLQHVAFTGRLTTKQDEPKTTQDPIEFTLTDGPENILRAAACKALGAAKDEFNIPVLLEVLPVAEKKLGDKRDDASIKAIITALGEIGIKNDEVDEVMKRFAKDFPKATERASGKLKEVEQ